MLYCIAIASIKLSILLLITRIFLAVKRNALYWVMQVLMWVNTAFYAIAVFLAIFACRPRRKIWSPEVEGKCLDSKSLYITSATFNSASDLVMLSVPLHIIWKLQMSTKRKIGISAIFGTGLLFVLSLILTAASFAHVWQRKYLLHSTDLFSDQTHWEQRLLLHPPADRTSGVSVLIFTLF